MNLKKKSKKRIKASHKAGMPPGSLIYIGNKELQSSVVKLIKFNMSELHESYIETDIDIKHEFDKTFIHWFQVNGLNKVETMKTIGEFFKLDTLILEDIMNTDHRPKIEIFDEYLFLILKTIKFNPENYELEKEHLCVICNNDYLVTFKESDNSFFNPLITRINSGKGKIKTKNYDYLLYAIVDMVVDSYLETIESINEAMENIEYEISQEPTKESLIRLEKYRKVIIDFRKTVVPIREITTELIRDEFDFLEEENEKYFRDVYDHTLYLIENIDNLTELNNSIKDIYHSTISYRMNQVMQVLTIYTVIFTPITFIAGVYGMNFLNMPELQFKYGYFIVLGIMALIVSLMMVYFKRKRWL